MTKIQSVSKADVFMMWQKQGMSPRLLLQDYAIKNGILSADFMTSVLQIIEYAAQSTKKGGT